MKCDGKTRKSLNFVLFSVGAASQLYIASFNNNYHLISESYQSNNNELQQLLLKK